MSDIITKLIEEEKLMKFAQAVEDKNEDQIFEKIFDEIYGPDFDKELDEALSILNSL